MVLGISRTTAIRWTGLFSLLLALLGALGCARDESEHMAKARELEQKLLTRGGEITYADPGYLPVARELEQVPPWSEDYPAASAQLKKIKDARRLQAGSVYGLDYKPSSLAGTDPASLAPPQVESGKPPAAVPPPAPDSAAAAQSVSPPSNAENIPVLKVAPSPPPMLASDRSGQKPVIMYSTSWCGFCRKARTYFTKNQVPFVDKDVEQDPAAAREMMSKVGGNSGVPVIDIDGTIVQGFDLPRIEAALARR